MLRIFCSGQITLSMDFRVLQNSTVVKIVGCLSDVCAVQLLVYLLCIIAKVHSSHEGFNVNCSVKKNILGTDSLIH